MIILSFFAAFLISFFSAPILRKLAIQWQIVDKPAVRKLQAIPVPLLGGVAVYLGLIAGIILFPLCDKAIGSIFLASALIFIVSVIDDKRELSATLRILVQLVAASILIASGLRISFLPSGIFFDAIEIFITIAWILGITNAFNYLDGIDGLCAGIGAISSLFFFAILFFSGQHAYAVLPLSLVGACLGFMPHNFKKDKMFLGDSGSMLIGFVSSAIALLGDWASKDIIRITVPILILGVPIFDMTFTTIMRYKERKIRTVIQWFEYAGRDHFHHYLMDLGLHQFGAAFFIFAVNISMGISALIIAKSDRIGFAILTIIKGGIMFGLVAVLMVLGRRLHKDHLVKERMGI